MMNEGAQHELPGGWVWTRLGEIGTINPKTKGENIEDDTEVTFLPMRCVEELTGCFDLSLTKRFSEVKKGYTPFVDGDLIFAKITPCMENGKIAIVKGLKNGMGFGSTEFHVIRLSKIIPGKFLFYFLVRQELRKDAKRNMTGSAGQLRVSTIYIQQIIFPLPPFPEQRAIVSKIEQLFSDLDNGIDNFKKAQAQLKLYRQSLLKAACEGKLVPTEAELARAEGRDYEAADVLLARILKERREKWNGNGKYKEPEALDTNGLPELPTGWCWSRLDSLAALKGGITKDQNRKIADTRKIPYLRVANVQRGYLDLSEIKEIEAQESVISELLLKLGDILFNEGGDRDKLGRGCIWNGEIEECIHQNHVFRARIYSNDISNKIISWFGNSFGQSYFMKQGKQTTNLASINRTKLSAFPVPLPPLAEQRRIVAEVERRLSVSDKMEATITESLQKAESLRQSVLKKAFEGKLLNKKEMEKARNAPDWEPAERLLERIRQEKQIKEKNNKPQRSY